MISLAKWLNDYMFIPPLSAPAPPLYVTFLSLSIGSAISLPHSVTVTHF